MAEGSEVEPVDDESKGKRQRYVPTEEDRLLLEDLGLPEISGSRVAAMDEVLDALRVARSNARLKAVFFGDKSMNSAPGVLQGKEATIKFVRLSIAKASLTQLAKPLRDKGLQVVPYAKGYLVAIDRDED